MTSDPIERRFRAIFGTSYFGQESLYSFEELSAHIPRDLVQTDRVLDVGCGNGAFTVLVASQTGACVYGIDANSDAVREGRAREFPSEACQLEFEVLDMDFLDQCRLAPFRFVYSLDALQHSSDLPRALRTLIRSLVPGGTFFASIWCFEPSSGDLARRWGFPRQYTRSQVEQAMQRLKINQFATSPNRNFVERCAASRASWESEREFFRQHVGEIEYARRLALEEATAEAAAKEAVAQVEVTCSV